MWKNDKRMEKVKDLEEIVERFYTRKPVISAVIVALFFMLVIGVLGFTRDTALLAFLIIYIYFLKEFKNKVEWVEL